MECLQLGAESRNSKEIHLEKNHGQRLFRKLLPTYFPGQAVGKHTLASYGKRLATAIGLTTPEKYTGHCWRRTAATLAAEAGSSLAEIKTLTGHKSDTVVNHYINNSETMKVRMAETLDCDKENRNVRQRTERTEKNSVLKQEPAIQSFNFHNCTFGPSTSFST